MPPRAKTALASESPSAVKHVEVKPSNKLAQQRRSVLGVRRKSLHAPTSSSRRSLKHPGLNEMCKSFLLIAKRASGSCSLHKWMQKAECHVLHPASWQLPSFLKAATTQIKKLSYPPLPTQAAHGKNIRVVLWRTLPHPGK